MSLQHANSHRDLIVYQKSRQLQREMFKLAKSVDHENPAYCAACAL